MFIRVVDDTTGDLMFEKLFDGYSYHEGDFLSWEGVEYKVEKVVVATEQVTFTGSATAAKQWRDIATVLVSVPV